MIVRLNARYSWAALLAASARTKQILKNKEKGFQARRDSFIVGYRAENAVRQHLGIEPKDRESFSYDLVYNHGVYDIKLHASEGFFFEPHQIACTGFIVVKMLQPQVFDIYGYITASKAWAVAKRVEKQTEEHVQLMFVHSRFLTRWLDSRGIIGVAGNQESA